MREWREGIFSEVIKHDNYGIRNLDFIPDYVIDIGANIGLFSMMARVLFPKADIVSVEPNIKNFKELQGVYGIKAIRAAISTGDKVYRPTMVDEDGKTVEKIDGVGSHYTYVSESSAFPKGFIEKCIPADVEVIKLSELSYAYPDKMRLLKCDCEGAEFNIFDDEKEFEALKTFHYIAMEVHFFAATSDVVQKSINRVMSQINQLEYTHTVKWPGKHMLHARMK